MKKLLVVMLLAVAMVAPVFATDKGAMELDVKLGYNVEPIMVETGYGSKYYYGQDSGFSLGSDFYYYVINNLAAGFGVNYVFDSNMDSWSEGTKLGATNIYLSVKPVLEVGENKFIDKVYFLGQLGLGITRYDQGDRYDFSQSGLYWGIGAGVEKYNVIVELSYSVNYWVHSDQYWSDNYSYTNRRLAINIGYKFNI